MPDILTLADALDDAAIFSLEHQEHLAELIGEHSVSSDLNVPTLELVGRRSFACTRVHLLGTAAPGSRSWLWGWAHPGPYPQQLTELSEKIRDFGQRTGIAELTEAEVPFSALPVLGDPVAIGLYFADAVKPLTGCWTSYISQASEASGGTRVAFLVEHPEFRLPQVQAATIERIVRHALAQPLMTNHKRALLSYAAHRGLSATFNADRTELALDAPGLHMVFQFDHKDRVDDIHSSLSDTCD